jgi:hypothetical protein
MGTRCSYRAGRTCADGKGKEYCRGWGFKKGETGVDLQMVRVPSAVCSSVPGRSIAG